MIDYENAEEQFQEFKRLHKKQVDCFEIADPEYLTHLWYYPLYQSFDLFIDRFPNHRDRVILLEQLHDDAVQIARGFERAELDIQGMSICSTGV